MSSLDQTAQADQSEDVSDFLRRIKELGEKRDSEDEERRRKLEQDIADSRELRRAKRAERARSLSPEKDSPLPKVSSPKPARDTPPLSRRDSPPTINSPLGTADSPRPMSLQPSPDHRTDDGHSEDPSKNTRPSMERIPSPPKATSGTNTPLLRSGTLSWQQRPSSVLGPRSRPLSVAERSATSTSSSAAATPQEPKSEGISRIQIAQSLGAKDPSWFRQTPDRGAGSPAYRKSRDEEQDSKNAVLDRRPLHGLSSDTTPSLQSSASLEASFASDRTSELNTPAAAATNDEESRALSKTLLTRPESPTKGMGGFVQSAMLKRSESVSKRWSSQAAPGLTRHNSNNSLLPGLQPSVSMPRLGEPVPESKHDSEQTAATTIRQSSPTRSSHHRAQSSISGDVQSPPGSSKRWSPLKSSWLESALSKPEQSTPSPSLGASQPSWMADLARNKQQRRADNESPTREANTTAAREIGFPGSPLASSPSWTKPITASTLPETKTESRSRPVSQTQDQIVSGSKPAFQSPISSRPPSPTKDFALPILKPVSSKSDLPSGAGSGLAEASTVRIKPVSALRQEPASLDSIATKVKPTTPPKKDFRSALKSREPPSEVPKNEEPEFKNVFGNLKRTKTVNYVAPDELKGNILRGKAGLTQTEGPKKTERRDELKEDLLRQKEAMKAKVPNPTGKAPTPRKPSGSITPEAIAKRKALGSNNSFGNAINSPSKLQAKGEADVERPIVEEMKTESFVQSTPVSPALQTKASSNKMADRFNPNLASVLSRGPLPIKSPTDSSPGRFPLPSASTPSRNSNEDDEQQGTGELQHMTKSRARGPKRRAPKGTAAPSVKGRTAGAEDKPIPQEPSSKATPPLMSKTISPIASDLGTIPVVPLDKSLPPVAPSKPNTPMKSPLLSQRQLPSSPVDVASLPPRPVLSTKPSKPSTLGSVVPQAVTSQDKPVPPNALKTSTASAAVLAQPSKATTAKADIPSKDDYPTSKKETPPSLDGTTEPKYSSVKAASALWGKKAGEALPPVAKEPITLPTYRDSREYKQEDFKKPASSSELKPSTRPTPATKPHLLSALAETKTKLAAQPLASKVASSAASPRASQASQIFADFFDTPPVAPRELDVNVSAIVTARPEAGSNITTLRKQISEISTGGKVSPLPSGQEHILNSERIYVCNHIFRDEQSGARITEVYLWAGTKVSDAAVEDSQLFAKRAAKESSGKLYILRQGKETANFLQALGGTVIFRSSDASPYILCGRQHLGHLVFDEVPYAASTLCSGFPFIVSNSPKSVYLWKGAGASVNEVAGAKLIAMDLCPSGQFTAEIDEGSESPDFLSAFATSSAGKQTIPRSAGHWKLKPSHDQYTCRLFRVEWNEPALANQGTGAGWGFNLIRRASQAPPTGTVITEIAPFSPQDLEPENVYVLDAFFEMYIIPSPLSRSKPQSFAAAVLFAQEYSILCTSIESRPHVPFASVVLEGAPRDMKACFRGWEDRADTSLLMAGKPRRAGSLRVLGLREALGGINAA